MALKHVKLPREACVDGLERRGVDNSFLDFSKREERSKGVGLSAPSEETVPSPPQDT